MRPTRVASASDNRVSASEKSRFSDLRETSILRFRNRKKLQLNRGVHSRNTRRELRWLRVREQRGIAERAPSVPTAISSERMTLLYE